MKKNMEKFNLILNKYKSLSAPAKAGIWFTICGFIQKGISFVTVPIFTRMLSTAQYGTVSVYNSWLSLVSIFCTLNLFYGGFNNGMLDYEDRRDEYVSSIQGLITVITGIWIIIYLIVRPLWNNLFEMNTTLVIVMFVEILASAALSLWSARERYEFKYICLVIITIVNAVLASVLSIIAVVVFDNDYGAEAKILAHAFVVIIICGSIYLLNFKKGKKFIDSEIWKGAFLFNLPLLPHYLSMMILNQSDRIMISKMVGASEAGIYSVAHSAAMILNILTTSINNSYAPWLYGRLKSGEYDTIPKKTNILFIGVASILIILIIFAPEAIYILAGRKYTDAIKIIPSVAASLYFIFMYQIFANVEFYYKKNKFIAYASVFGAALNIILNYICIKQFGYIAAGYTTLVCYIVFGVSHYIFMKKICKNVLPDINLFDRKTVFVVGIVLIIFSVIMNCLYDYVVERYVFLIIVVILVFIYRNKITELVKTLKNK